MIKLNLGESKVLLYFGSMKLNSASLGSFAKVVKVTTHTGLTNSPDTLQMQLTRFASMVWSMATESIVDLTWLLSFLQPEQNFLTVWILYCDQLHLHLLHKKCFSLLLWCYGPVWTQSISYQIRLYFIFMSVAFKSHKEWSNAHVIAPTTMMLPTTAGTYHGLNCWSHVICTPNYQNKYLKNMKKNSWCNN